MKKLNLVLLSVFLLNLACVKIHASTSGKGFIFNYENKLDSIVTYNKEGEFIKKYSDYVFSDTYLLISCIEKYTDTSYKHEYEYDDCSNQSAHKILRFNENGDWILKLTENYIYQNDNNCGPALLTEYNMEGVLQSEFTSKKEKTSYEFTEEKNVLSYTKEDGDNLITQKIINTYNNEGKIETTISYLPVESILTPSSKIAYTYFDPSEKTDHFKSETIYRYDEEQEIVCIITSNNISRLQTDKELITTVEFYDLNGSTLLNKEIKTVKYSDNLSTAISTTIQMYDENGTLRSTYKYDDSGNLLDPTELEQMTGNDEENTFRKGEWNYDKTNGMDTYQVFLYDNQIGTKELLWSLCVYYEKNPNATNTPTNDLKNRFFSVYPNPAKDNIYITGNNDSDGFSPVRYQIYDAGGKLQTRGIISDENTPVAIQSLSSGTYIISLDNGKNKGAFVFMKD